MKLGEEIQIRTFVEKSHGSNDLGYVDEERRMIFEGIEVVEMWIALD